MKEMHDKPIINSYPVSPAIIKKFHSLDENAIFHHKYNLRHPGAIFNITSEYIVESLIQFVDLVSKNEFESEGLFKGYRLVLYDFFKFYDSCFEIMACFCNVEKKWDLFIDRWLEKNEFVSCKNFKTNVAEDIRILRLEYNKLKHTSNRINWLNQYCDNCNCFGYYLEKSGEEGKSEPENLTDYPISLNRQIRHIYYAIFKLSEELTNELNLVAESQNLNFESSNIEVASEEKWKLLFDKINHLPNLYLLSEVNKKVYIPTLINGNLSFVLEKIDATYLASKYTNPIRANVITTGDGYTKTFSIPNLGGPLS